MVLASAGGRRLSGVVPDMTSLHHLIGRATDIFTSQVINGPVSAGSYLVSFICDHVGEPTHSDGQ